MGVFFCWNSSLKVTIMTLILCTCHSIIGMNRFTLFKWWLNMSHRKILYSPESLNIIIWSQYDNVVSTLYLREIDLKYSPTIIPIALLYSSQRSRDLGSDCISRISGRKRRCSCISRIIVYISCIVSGSTWGISQPIMERYFSICSISLICCSWRSERAVSVWNLYLVRSL